MEDNKVEVGHVVKDTASGKSPKLTPKVPQKKTYEELEQYTRMLEAQYQQLINAYNQAMDTITIKRIEFLFKVVDNNEKFPKDFVDKVINELVVSLTIPEREFEGDTPEGNTED